MSEAKDKHHANAQDEDPELDDLLDGEYHCISHRHLAIILMSFMARF
jgi:hypothetical protein